MFRGLKKRAWKQIETLEWKLKKKCSPSSFGNGKIFGARRRGDPYHLDLVLLPLLRIPGVGFFSYQYRIEHAEQDFLHGNLLDLDRENRTDFMKPCAMARIHSQSYFLIDQLTIESNFSHYLTIHNKSKESPRKSGLEFLAPLP